jgi:hypothetical protein
MVQLNHLRLRKYAGPGVEILSGCLAVSCSRRCLAWNMEQSGQRLAAIIQTLLGDFQVGEVTFGARPNPKRHGTFRVAELQVVHDEAGLGGGVHI